MVIELINSMDLLINIELQLQGSYPMLWQGLKNPNTCSSLMNAD